MDPKMDNIYTAEVVARIASSRVSKKMKKPSTGTSSSSSGQIKTQEVENCFLSIP